MARTASTAFAAKYARALLDVLEGSHADVEAAERELGDFAAAWEESHELRNVYIDPSIQPETKLALLDKLNTRLGMSKVVRNFIAVIVNHERMENFEAIWAEFRTMVRGDLHIAKVEWTTARSLSAEEQQAVEARLAEMTGGRVEANFKEDPALLGGARLQIGSTVYDGSVRGRLDQIREALVS